VEMGKCWTFARVTPQALKALREVYKAEENKAVRVRAFAFFLGEAVSCVCVC
jgi:hypothetical protein